MGAWDLLRKEVERRAMIEEIKDHAIEVVEASQGSHRYSSFKIDYLFPVKFDQKNIKKIFDFLKDAYIKPKSWELVGEKYKEKYSYIQFSIREGFWQGFYNFIKFEAREHKGQLFLIEEQEVTSNRYLTEENKKEFEEVFFYNIGIIKKMFLVDFLKEKKAEVILNVDKSVLPNFFDVLTKAWEALEEIKVKKKQKPTVFIFENDDKKSTIRHEMRLKVVKGKPHFYYSQKVIKSDYCFSEQQVNNFQEIIEEYVNGLYIKLGLKKPKKTKSIEKFCAECGEKVKKTAKFCESCGKKQ